jgi:hypothetical protein
MEKIDTYLKFKALVVDVDFNDFIGDKGNLRKAWHCAGSLFHLHDWVYQTHKSTIDSKYKFVDDQGRSKPVSRVEHFANALGQTFKEFQLIRGIANSSKHFVLKPAPSGRVNPPGMPSHAANTYVVGMAFDPGSFQTDAFQTGDVKLQASPEDIEFAVLAKSVLDMWERLFTTESW